VSCILASLKRGARSRRTVVEGGCTDYRQAFIPPVHSCYCYSRSAKCIDEAVASTFPER
jgi:hypothetical protein